MPVAQITLTDLISLSGHVEKLGIIGFLVLVVAVLSWALVKFRKENARIYRQRDRARMKESRYKAYLDQAKIPVDVSDIDALFREDAAEEG